MTEPTNTPIYDQLIREREQHRCPPDPQDDTGPDQAAEPHGSLPPS